MPIILRGYVIIKFLLLLILPLAVLPAAEPPVNEADVTFREFPWGTSQEEVIRKMGRPLSREEVNGLVSLAWENVKVDDYTAYMIAYFSPSGLQGGTYFFLTDSRDEIIRCYREMRDGLREKHGTTYLFDNIVRDKPPWESSWNLPGGYIYLKASVQRGEPVTLWYSSPELTKQITGN